MDAQQDWRLEARLAGERQQGALDRLIGRARGGDELAEQLDAAVSDDVVVSHDGDRVFAYAGDEAGVRAARGAIDAALRGDELTATFAISRWDHELDDWRQVDPPPDAAVEGAYERVREQADRVVTRTMVVSAGKLARDILEQTMRAAAAELGLECEVVEHPHLLSVQVAFTVTGAQRKVDEFRAALAAEGAATVRADSIVLNPL